MNTSNKPKTWFWIVAVLALIWNLMGVMAYIGSVTLSPEQLEQMSEAEREIRENTPAWATGAFAIATFGGALASLLLLLRKALAVMLYYVSFIAVLVQMYFAFVVVDSMAMFGPGEIIMPIMIVGFAIGLIYLSRKVKSYGWIS